MNLLFFLEHTYGFHRAEVIAALVSVLTIWVLTGFLVMEAIERVRSPQVIDAKLVSLLKIIYDRLSFLIVSKKKQI